MGAICACARLGAGQLALACKRGGGRAGPFSKPFHAALPLTRPDGPHHLRRTRSRGAGTAFAERPVTARPFGQWATVYTGGASSVWPTSAWRRPGYNPRRLPLDGAVLDLRMTLVPDLVVEIGQAVIHHDDIEVRARGRIAARETGLDLAIDATLPEIEVATALAYWPERRCCAPGLWFARQRDRRARLTVGVDFALRGCVAG